MKPETIAYIAVGSNIEPLANVSRALEMLAEVPCSRLIAESIWYRTRPWGIEEQAEFINLVVALATTLSPGALLQETRAIEMRLSRVRTVKNGPRTIDLDILLHGQEQISSPDLTLPHPGLLERDFMLVPMLDIAPQAVHPVAGLQLRELTGELRYRQIIGPMQKPW